MAKSKKLTRKRKHKRDVAEKRRARVFYRTRQQDRQDYVVSLPDVPTWVDYATWVIALAGLAVAVVATCGLTRAIINM